MNHDRWDKAQIVVQSLKSGERKVIVRGGSAARYVRTGHLIYALAGTLIAIPFDVNKLEVRGAAVPIIERVMRTNTVASAAAQFSFAENGSLLYIPGPAGATTEQTLALVDREGKAQSLPFPPRAYQSPR